VRHMVDPEARRNILVVDDEAQITRVLKTTLSAQGYGIRTAADGMQALLEMKSWPPGALQADSKTFSYSDHRVVSKGRGDDQNRSA
jgi:two-component system KDP operon response regulator KdpE